MLNMFTASDYSNKLTRGGRRTAQALSPIMCLVSPCEGVEVEKSCSWAADVRGFGCWEKMVMSSAQESMCRVFSSTKE